MHCCRRTKEIPPAAGATEGKGGSEGSFHFGGVDRSEQRVGCVELLGVDDLMVVVEVAVGAEPAVDFDGAAEHASSSAIDPVVVDEDGHRSKQREMHCCRGTPERPRASTTRAARDAGASLVE